MTPNPPPDQAGPGPARGDFHLLAAAVAHALRTPLAALSGEVELALHRERTAEAYRAALRRIADRVAELDELTGDLASFGSSRAEGHASGTAGLQELLASIAALAEPDVRVEGPPANTRLAGDRHRLARALTLLVRHAARHRADGGHVRIQVASPAGDETGLDLRIGASPPRFPGRTWLHLAPPGDGESLTTAGLFGLRTAAHLVEQCGGSIHVENQDGSDAVRVRLRRAGADDR